MLTVDFSRSGNSHKYKVLGWSHCEEEYTWSIDNKSILRIPSPPKYHDIISQIKLRPFLNEPMKFQRILIICNGVVVYSHYLDKECCIQFTIFSEYYFEAEFIEIELIQPDTTSPMFFGSSTDERMLGFAIYHINFTKNKERFFPDESTLFFGSNGSLSLNLSNNEWYDPEGSLCWNSNTTCSFVFDAAKYSGRNISVTILCSPFRNIRLEYQRVFYSVNGYLYGFCFFNSRRTISFTINNMHINSGLNVIQFNIPDWTIPCLDDINTHDIVGSRQVFI